MKIKITYDSEDTDAEKQLASLNSCKAAHFVVFDLAVNLKSMLSYVGVDYDEEMIPREKVIEAINFAIDDNEYDRRLLDWA